MNPIKLIRKLGNALRGGATFREMFLAVFLGFAVGMIPGVNLTLFILIALLLFLNTNGALAALAVIVGKALCLLLAPLTFQLGYLMMHKLGLVGLVRVTADVPVLALLDLHVYCLLGAIPLILVLGIPLGWFVGRSTVKMRARIAAATAGDERLRKASQNKFAKLVLRIVFGKQKESMAEMAAKKTPLIRKGRVIAGAVVVVVLVVLQFIFLDGLVKRGLEKGLAATNGAEVNIADADLSLGSGRLVLEDLQVTDAARPELNRVQAERLVADVSIGALLTRRLVVDLVEVEAMRMDAKRSSPGKVYRTEEAEPSAAEAAGGLLGKLSPKAEYYEEVNKFNERLTKLRRFLESEESTATEPDKAKLAEQAKATGYLKLSAKDYLTKRPTWVIREIKVSRIETKSNLPTFTAEGKNLSSHPSRYPEKVQLSARPDEEALKAFVAKPKEEDESKTAAPAEQKEGEEKKGLLEGLLGK